MTTIGPFTELTLAHADYEGRIAAIMHDDGVVRGIAIYDLYTSDPESFWRHDEALLYLDCAGIGDHACA